MIKIVDIDYLGEYSMLITFNDGKMKEVNLKHLTEEELYSELKNKDVFIQYGLINGTIEWITGADIAPEYLYEIGKLVKEKSGSHSNV